MTANAETATLAIKEFAKPDGTEAQANRWIQYLYRSYGYTSPDGWVLWKLWYALKAKFFVIWAMHARRKTG